MLVCVLILTTSRVLGQDDFGIQNPGSSMKSKCKECFAVLSALPKEVEFGTHHDDMGNIYFVMTDKSWFDQLFTSKYDGIAADIVTKDQFVCNGTNNFSASLFSRGKLLKPVYKKDFEKATLPTENGNVVIRIGQVPNDLIGKDYEVNLIFLKNKFFCHYNAFFDLKSYKWDLLDMGMYMDTLTYKQAPAQTSKANETVVLSNKRMIFTIPFEKNRSEYSPADIKPMYDSLKLTSFNITHMSIRAYSSIEGSEIRNIELQQKRAESIQQALQSFQSPTISTSIQASENWVEFFNDIESSPYASLSTLSKAEIKNKFKDNTFLNSMEPILKNHRKAIVIIELEKKNTLQSLTESALVDAFTQAIQSRNIERASEIQENIFQQIGAQKLPPTLVNKLDIPRQKEFGDLINNNLSFNYLNNIEGAYKTLLNLQELSDLLPQSGHIKYNICVLKFKVWLQGDIVVDEKKFLKEINDLKLFKISNSLIKRMLINYNIVLGEKYMALKDYKNKDKSILFINSNYKQIPYSAPDLLSIAQYFSAYAKYDWAIALLTPYVSKIDADEDLLFYFLNLTLINDKLTRKLAYRNIMLNAINLNKDRYCSLFNTYGTGGITFQLLQNNYLKDTYCENCTNHLVE